MTNIVSRWTALGESHYTTAASCEPIHQPRPLSVQRHLPTSPPAVLPTAHTHSPPVPPQPYAESKRATEAKLNVPTAVLHPAPMSPLAQAQDKSPIPDIQSRDPQLPVAAVEDSTMPITPHQLPTEPATRPRRLTRPSKRYEPETGQWVT